MPRSALRGDDSPARGRANGAVLERPFLEGSRPRSPLDRRVTRSAQDGRVKIAISSDGRESVPWRPGGSLCSREDEVESTDPGFCELDRFDPRGGHLRRFRLPLTPVRARWAPADALRPEELSAVRAPFSELGPRSVLPADRLGRPPHRSEGKPGLGLRNRRQRVLEEGQRLGPAAEVLPAFCFPSESSATPETRSRPPSSWRERSSTPSASLRSREELAGPDPNADAVPLAGCTARAALRVNWRRRRRRSQRT